MFMLHTIPSLASLTLKSGAWFRFHFISSHSVTYQSHTLQNVVVSATQSVEAVQLEISKYAAVFCSDVLKV